MGCGQKIFMLESRYQANNHLPWELYLLANDDELKLGAVHRFPGINLRATES
jgi:hypothetical protein